MTRRVLCSLFLISTLFSYARAKPVLVAVELADRTELERWLEAGHPTYEYLAKTAMAEVEDSEVPALGRRGFNLQVIDQSPWSERYFLGTLTQESRAKVSGMILWRKGEICLLKLPADRIPELLRLRALLHPFDKEELPARYWEKLLAKHVPLKALGWDPLIQSIVDEVSTDSLTVCIQRLQDFGSRLALGDSSYAASAWLARKLSDWGYDVELDSFYMEGSQLYDDWPGVGYERNVIGTVTGALDPSRIFIIGGHFDSVVRPDTALARIDAPGADDNATGMAGVLEAARVMRGHSWDATMKFVGWAAEETGADGSTHHADNAEDLGLDIGGVVGLDMIGYMDDAALDCRVQVKDELSFWLADLFRQAAETYAPALLTYRVFEGGTSDWWYYARRGFAAIGGAERHGSFMNPYMHTPGDVIETLTPGLYTIITQASVATMAVLGLHPGVVEDVAVRDVGDGDGLAVSWSPNVESDVVGYTVYWGTASEAYTDSHYVDGIASTADSLVGFITDCAYYFVVRALDGEGRESYVATEVTGVPRVEPTAPVDVAATPIQSGIRVHWPPNPELDIAGYSVYRRVNEAVTYDTVTAGILQDTTLTDYPLDGASKYYYAVQAFDVTGNGSALSEEAYGRPITLDQGILLVDETRNHQTLPDSVQDEFYAYVMAGSQYTEHEFGPSAQPPVLADLGPYSAVVWHADDFYEPLAWHGVDAVRDYLETGGNLWFVGWQPTANLEGAVDYPYSFASGDFIYDYVKVSASDVSSTTDSLQGAFGVLGYPDITVDPEKVPVPSWGGTMRYVEALTSVSPAEDIYTIDMQNDDSPFEGCVCGIRYLGADFKVVYLGFPLYYMDREQARILAQKVLKDFGEPVGVADGPANGIRASRLTLYQNLPNPFSEQTTISYSIPEPGRVTLRVYNLTGQLVSTLVDARRDAGLFAVKWNGTDQRGTRVGSGTYYYKLQAGAGTATRRLTVLR